MECIVCETKNYYWVYILLCENDTYYTGYTNHLIKRYKNHLSRRGRCKYTRSFKPIYLAQCWVFREKSQAMKVEYLIKQLPRNQKTNLINFPHLIESSIFKDFRIKVKSPSE